MHLPGLSILSDPVHGWKEKTKHKKTYVFLRKKNRGKRKIGRIEFTKRVPNIDFGKSIGPCFFKLYCLLKNIITIYTHLKNSAARCCGFSVHL